MRKNVCYIVGASTFDERIKPLPGDYVIACDKGYKYLTEQNIKPDCSLGDFDSLCDIPNEENLFVYPSEKNDTDMKLALNHAIEKGYEKFYIFGSLGGRLDHTLANIQMLLFLAKKNFSAYLIGEGTKVTAIHNSVFKFTGKENGYFSVFAIGSDAQKVTVKNAKYNIKNQKIFCDDSLGVSNEFLPGKSAEISVINGSLCIVWYEKFNEGIGAENEN